MIDEIKDCWEEFPMAVKWILGAGLFFGMIFGAAIA